MNQIINILKKKKSIALDQFIDIALYDKKNGYYMKKNPFGKKGDFITAPLISNLFGEMIAVWCVAFWENLKKPKKILIVELGPGDGTLCNDLLNSFKNFKSFYNSVEVNLLEKSTKLKNIQKKKIHNKKVKWINKLEQIDSGPIIFIGNEFFDSLPIKQLHKTKNLFFEKHICLTKDQKKIKFIYKKAKEKLIKSIQNFKLTSESGIIEFPGESIKYLEIISQLIKKFNGGLLILDYGYTQKISGNSLQSVKDHKYKDVFLDPGNADITSHVNYQLFFNILRNKKLCVKEVVTQNEFLQKLGIIERANILAKKMSFNAKIDMFYRLKKLLDDRKMGHLFKVLFAQKKGGKFSLGF